MSSMLCSVNKVFKLWKQVNLEQGRHTILLRLLSTYHLLQLAKQLSLECLQASIGCCCDCSLKSIQLRLQLANNHSC